MPYVRFRLVAVLYRFLFASCSFNYRFSDLLSQYGAVTGYPTYMRCSLHATPVPMLAQCLVVCSLRTSLNVLLARHHFALSSSRRLNEALTCNPQSARRPSLLQALAACYLAGYQKEKQPLHTGLGADPAQADARRSLSGSTASEAMGPAPRDTCEDPPCCTAVSEAALGRPSDKPTKALVAASSHPPPRKHRLSTLVLLAQLAHLGARTDCFLEASSSPRPLHGPPF